MTLVSFDKEETQKYFYLGEIVQAKWSKQSYQLSAIVYDIKGSTKNLSVQFFDVETKQTTQINMGQNQFQKHSMDWHGDLDSGIMRLDSVQIKNKTKNQTSDLYFLKLLKNNRTTKTFIGTFKNIHLITSS